MHDSVLKNIELDVQKLNAKYGRVVAKVVWPYVMQDQLTDADFQLFEAQLARDTASPACFTATDVFQLARQRPPTHGELIRVGRQCAARYARIKQGARAFYRLKSVDACTPGA